LRASRIASPHWGHRGAVSGSFRTSINGSQCGEHFRPRRSTGQYCSLTCRKASARFRTVSVPQLRNGGVDDILHYRLPQPLALQTSSPRFRLSSTRSPRNTTETQLRHN
jgi:hypothetical protein